MTPAPGTKPKDEQAFGPPGQEAVSYSWAHANVHYLPNEARREAESAIQAARNEAKHWADAAQEWERRLDEAEKQKKECEVEAMRKVHEISWASVKQATEYEDRIKMLEELIEEERATHEEALQKHEMLAKQAVGEAQKLSKETEERCNKLIAEAKARVKETQERADATCKHAEEEVLAARAREETRVEEIRRWMDARVRECEDQKVFEIQQMREKTLQRQRQMEESLYLNGRQKSEALAEAKRHMTSVEQEQKEWRAMQEIEFARKEARLDEWTEKQRRQNSSLETHHKGMLELEKGLHGRTMQRTMERVNRQIEYGDAATGGRETPTREAIRDLPSSARSGGGLPALTASPKQLVKAVS